MPEVSRTELPQQGMRTEHVISYIIIISTQTMNSSEPLRAITNLDKKFERFFRSLFG